MGPNKLLLAFAGLIGVAVFLGVYKDDLSGGDENTAGGGDGTVTGLVVDMGGGGGVSLTNTDIDPDADPEKLRAADMFGWKSYPPAMAAADDTILNAHAVLTGLPTKRRLRQQPADYRILAHETGCTPRPPQAGERLVNISIGRAERPTDLHAYSEAEMAEDSLKWLTQVLNGKNYLKDDGIVRDHFVPVADVVLTDRSAPLYLVLQNGRNDVLWNLHAVPGVRIAHVATISAGTVALNPVPGEYGIQMFRAGGECVPKVARRPMEFWGLFQREQDDELRAIQARMAGNHATYDAWFRKAFGQPSEQGTIGFDLTHHVLVGPVPENKEARVPYRPIQGATVLITPQDYIFTAPKRDRVAFMMDLQRQLIAEAAGGDMAALSPAPMERTVQ